jgi:hypothetical protein
LEAMPSSSPQIQREARMAVCCLPLCRRHWPCLLYAQAGRPQIRADQAAVRADRHDARPPPMCPLLAESQNRMPFFSASPTCCASALRRRGRVLHCPCASPPHHLLVPSGPVPSPPRRRHRCTGVQNPSTGCAWMDDEYAPRRHTTSHLFRVEKEEQDDSQRHSSQLLPPRSYVLSLDSRPLLRRTQGPATDTPVRSETLSRWRWHNAHAQCGVLRRELGPNGWDLGGDNGVGGGGEVSLEQRSRGEEGREGRGRGEWEQGGTDQSKPKESTRRRRD